jgi:hypothetical protein
MPTSEEERLLKIVDVTIAHERLYATVGKIASNWAAFEAILHNSLWVLAKVEDEAGACLTAQIPNVSRALDAFAALVRLRGGSDALITRIRIFTEKTHGLSSRRNRAIHSPWNRDWETGKASRLVITAQKKLVFGPEEVDLAHMSKLVDDTHDHVQTFEKIIAEVSEQLSASAGISFRSRSKDSPRLPSGE